MERIPSYIFDWIENKSFDSLTDQQRKDVEPFFSKEEYQELYLTASSLHDQRQEPPDPSPVIRQILLSAFDKKYDHPEKPARSILLYPIHLWKAAAVFLLLGGGTLWIILQTRFHHDVTYITIKDTVYVPSYTTNNETIKTYDTSYVPNEEDSEKKMAKKGALHHRVSVVRDEKTETTASRVLKTNSFDKVKQPNKSEGSNLKDDTLLQ